MTTLRRKSSMNSALELRASPIGGKGLFANTLIPAGDTVLIFGGHYTNTQGAHVAQQAGKGVMQWDEDIWSVEDDSDDPVYCINHACDPNVWMQDAFTLVARRDIQPGEEITADYALWEADEGYVSAWDCHCGSANCRGRVTGRDWQSRQLQQAYQGHFSPLINKRINPLSD